MPASSLESLFASWLARREAGEDADLDDLCRAHPEHAAGLRDLHGYWQRIESLQRDFGLSGSLAERLRSVHGSGVDPQVELEGEGSADFTEELLGRLSGRTPSSGRYQLKGEVAHGGMGAVLRVWDEDLRRHLAMKVLLGRGDAERKGDTPPVDKRLLARFLEEAQSPGSSTTRASCRCMSWASTPTARSSSP